MDLIRPHRPSHRLVRCGNTAKRLRILGCLLAGALSAGYAQGSTVTYTGTLSGDDQVQQYAFTTLTATSVDFSTDSYGGGTANGTTTPSGGFVPVVSVFNASSGLLIASDGADGICSGAMSADSVTNICDDANLNLSLGSGSYIVAVSEFFNVPVGPNLSNGFLEQGQGNFTGQTCGTTGAFYETDLANCVQRTGNFTLDIATVPEPSDLWFALPLAAAVLLRRHAAK